MVTGVRALALPTNTANPALDDQPRFVPFEHAAATSVANAGTSRLTSCGGRVLTEGHGFAHTRPTLSVRLHTIVETVTS